MSPFDALNRSFYAAKKIEADVCEVVPQCMNASFDVGEILRNGLANDDEVLMEADITQEGTAGTELGLNTPPRQVPNPLNTPDVERENMATPGAVDHTPKSKLSMNTKVFIVSYTPSTPAKELRNNHCKAPPSAVQRTPLQSKNCSFSTPGKFDHLINVSMPDQNMHLIDLTTPTGKADIVRTTPKPKPRILSSFNLVTPSPKKISQTPTLAKNAPPSATKTLLKSALKNASSVSKGSASKAVVTPQRKKISSIKSISARGTPVKLAAQQVGQVCSDNSPNLACMPNLVNQSHDGNFIRKRRIIHSSAAVVDEIVKNGLTNDDELVMEADIMQDGTDCTELGLNTPARPVSDLLNTPDVALENMVKPVPGHNLINLMTPTEMCDTPSTKPKPKSHILFPRNHYSPKKDPQTPTFTKNAPHSATKTSAFKFKSALKKSSSVCKGSAAKPLVKPQRTKLSSIDTISARILVVSKRPGEEDFTVQQMNEVVSDDSTNLPFIAGIVTREDSTPEVPYLITHPTAVFNVEEVIKTPNRTTQVRSAKYSDVTPHESFVDGVSGQTAVEYIVEDSPKAYTNCTTSVVVNKLSFTPVQSTAVIAVCPSSPATEGD
uniref:Uncharacterized protein n=1 Tax=Anopheles atroparvus TaxID=41427 RepID=A0A182JIU7_ANOAO